MRRPRRKTAYSRYVRYPLQTALVATVLTIAKLVPLDAGSGFFGRLFRFLGPWLPQSRRARRSLELAMPEKSVAEREAILRDMWENLGRMIAEFAHMGRLTSLRSGRVEVLGIEHAKAAYDAGKGMILASGHLANWEIMAIVAGRYGLEMVTIARTPNNPYLEPLLRKIRGIRGGNLLPKTMKGAREAAHVLRRGGALGVLFDQRMREGMRIPFFGREAQTASGVAQLAMAVGCPILPARIERLQGSRFRVTCFPPIYVERAGDREARVREIMTDLNAMLEGWIREKPGDWLWLHRRFDKDLYD